MRRFAIVMTLLLIFSGVVLAQEQSLSGFKLIEASELEDNYARMMSQDWALVSAGTADSFNTMTISWGAFGNLWRMPVVMVYVKPARFTHSFIEREDRLTITLFGGECKDDLLYLGRNSGRDGDKISNTKLKTIFTPSGLPTFEQADVIIEGRKIYKSRFDRDEFVDKELWQRIYGRDTDEHHDAYILAIERIWKRVK